MSIIISLTLWCRLYVLQPDVSRITCEGALKLNAPAIQGDEVWASSAFMEVRSHSLMFPHISDCKPFLHSACLLWSD
jgi:hypothetical protein